MNQELFERGQEALKTGDHRAAARDFQDLMNQINEQHENYNQVISFLGLAQVLASNRNGLLLCRDAASSEAHDGQVFLNLAAAEWHTGNHKRAVEALRRGSKVDSGHVQLKHALQLVDCRQRPLFPFLPRTHVLNRFACRLKGSPSGDVSVQAILY